ncbi:translation initiation factor IF3-4, chloroplastic-like isoform X1 [Panicum virgatum]|uniref:translation initiation factor IF3-4, chloroplastic-like isoform X1 n=1 Tax=Panicum virgatum TaxID=38727 RepID=UPI0019D57C1F|nr:translation initiation factor IF3-4, chloroplastic-like isoform X1 [Panicum virgatum]XP_039791713.1 translation initiation factor IF3-4, chloroplastic-like isoform X1 [Panicum virgatum]
MVGVAFAPAVSRAPYRPGAVSNASGPSSSARFPARPWARVPAPARLVVVARYSSSYESDGEEDEEALGGGGWGRRDRGPDPDSDPALDIERIESSTVRLLDEQKRMVINAHISFCSFTDFRFNYLFIWPFHFILLLQVGVVSVNEAVQIADDNDLILAILSLDGDPPVLRLFEERDYKKHRYEQQKKKKIQQKRSVAKRMGLKELKMGYNIDVHDYSVRLKAARKFLKAGDKVKIIVNLKGRENLYKKEAIELLRRFQNDVGELATEESKNFVERNIYVVLVPNKIAIQKEQDELNRKDTAKEEKDQSDSDDGLLTEQLEESKEPEAELSANV